METVKLLLMAYLKYITEAEFVNILQSVLKVTKNGRHDKKSQSHPMEQQFLKYYFFATLSSVYPVTRQIKCCLQYTAVLNMAGYISSTSPVTQGKIIKKRCLHY